MCLKVTPIASAYNCDLEQPRAPWRQGLEPVHKHRTPNPASTRVYVQSASGPCQSRHPIFAGELVTKGSTSVIAKFQQIRSFDDASRHNSGSPTFYRCILFVVVERKSLPHGTAFQTAFRRISATRPAALYGP